MKSWFCSIFLLFAMPVFGTEAQQEAKPFVVVVMQDYEPVSFLAPNSGHKAIGVSPQIVEEAFAKEQNIKVEVRGLPWIRAQNMVKSGEVDAMIGVVTPERLRYTTASKVPAFDDAYRAFASIDHPRMPELKKIKQLGDLKDFTICEYLGSGWAKANLAPHAKRVEYGRSIKMKIDMLVAKRCDLIVDLDFLIRVTAKKMGVGEKIVELPMTFKGTAFHLMVSKKSPQQGLLAVFDRNAKILHKSGRVNEIIHKWESESP